MKKKFAALILRCIDRDIEYNGVVPLRLFTLLNNSNADYLSKFPVAKTPETRIYRSTTNIKKHKLILTYNKY